MFFNLLRKRISSKGIVNLSDKEQAYNRIVMKNPDASLVDVAYTPSTKIVIGRVGITFIPFGNNLYAFEIYKNVQTNSDIAIRDIGTLQKMLQTIENVTN